jgi:hypothetical protein
MFVPFGYLILRRVLHLIVLDSGGDRAREVEILALRQQSRSAAPSGQRLHLEPSDRAVLSAWPGCCPRRGGAE